MIEKKDFGEVMRMESILGEEITSFMDVLPDAVVVLDLDGKVLSVNTAFSMMLEINPEDVVGRHIFDLTDRLLSEDMERASEAFEALLSGKRTTSFEFGNEMKDGHKGFFSATYTLVRDGEGTHKGIIAIIRDITGQKETEDALRKRETEFKILADHVPAYFSYLDSGLHYRYVNKLYEQLFGKPTESIVGQHVKDIMGKDSFATIETYFDQALRGEETSFEVALPSHPAGPRWMSARFVPDLDEEGKAKGLFALINDVTERKRAEEALRESEEKYRSLFSKMLDGFALHEIIRDSNGKPIDYITLEVNESFEKILGIEKETVVGIKASQLLPAEELNEWLELFGQVAITGKSVHYEKYSALNDKYFQGFSYSSQKGQFVVTFKDITEHKRAEEALQESQEKYSSVVENSMDGIIVLQKGIIKFLNQAILDLSGYNLEELMDKEFETLLSPEYRKLIMDRYQARLAGKDVPSMYEMEIIRKDGISIPIEVSNTIMVYEGEKATLCFIRDITERKQAKDALQESEEKYRTLVEKSLEGVWQIDVKGITIFSSPRMGEILGYSTEEMLGKNFMEFMDEDAREEAKKLFERRKRGISEVHEFRFKHKTGADVYTELSTVSFMDKGVFNGGIAYISDITDRKKAEEALRISEEKYSKAFHASPDAILLTKLDTGHIYEVNEGFERMLGFSRDEAIGKTTQELGIWHDPNDREKILSLLNKGKGIKDTEFVFQKKSGENIVTLLTIGTLEIEDEKYAISIARDITDRKRAEDDMRKRLMKFDIEDGVLYLVKESVPTVAMEAFNDLAKIGYRGIVISRTPERDLIGLLEGDYEFPLVSEKGRENAVLPKIDKIEEKFKNLSRRDVVLMDRLDYLILKNGFKKTLSFIQRLRESAYLTGFVLLLSVDPLTLKERELKLLEKETAELSPRETIPLSEDLSEILRYVYQRNITGLKPSYTEICRELSISKPTVRKRIRHLLRAGYLLQDVKGRSKVVVLTEKGRSLFTK